MPARQPTADDLQQVLDQLARILNDDDPAKPQFEQFVREFYDV